MRVLHLTDHYPPVLGGIEFHVAALAERQARRGDDVTVLTSTSATADGEHRDDTGPVTVHRVDSVLAGLRLDARSFDVVHAHISVVAPFTAPVAAVIARRGVPTVVTVHSLWNGMGPVPATAARVVGLRSAPVLWTSVSRVAADQLERRLPRHTHASVLPNAVEVVPRSSSPAAHHDRPVRLVSTMRIARRKRPLQLLRMFEAVRDSAGVPVTLTIVGDGPLRSTLERHVARAGLADAVTLTGRVSPGTVQGLLAEADVYVAPAVLESFGLAALEARCVGLPVVGHAASGMTDFVRQGVEGLLCGSDREMVEGLRRLVLDGDLRQRISEHNRTVPSPMTWANSMVRHDTAYALACSTSTSRSPRSLRAVGDR